LNEQFREIKKDFEAIDKNGDGHVTKEELRQLMLGLE
jgi:Ca2+-binding EF-hand superfamily protein